MKASILVIDDEESLRFTFGRFLSLAGHRVDTAENCKEARERIDRSRFDCIFMDINLPDGSGLDLLETIGRMCPDCPVIVITAYPSVETARDSFRLGAFDYLAKPIRHAAVMESVKQALRQGGRKEAKEACRPPEGGKREAHGNGYP